MSTVPAIASAEASLVANVNAIAAALRGVASAGLDDALDNLRREASAAADRIAGAREYVAQALHEVFAALSGLSSDLGAGAAASLPPAEPVGALTAAALEADREARSQRQQEQQQPVELDESVIAPGGKEWPERPLPANQHGFCVCQGGCPDCDPENFPPAQAPLTAAEAEAAREELRHWGGPEVEERPQGDALTPEEEAAAVQLNEAIGVVARADLPYAPAPAANGRAKRRKGR